MNGVPLDSVLCVTCVQGTYPSPDCTRCLPCDGREYSGHANCVCPSATHVRTRDHCLPRDDVADWPDVRGTYLMKFRSESVDSYYLRNELQVAVHLCKVRATERQEILPYLSRVRGKPIRRMKPRPSRESLQSIADSFLKFFSFSEEGQNGVRTPVEHVRPDSLRGRYSLHALHAHAYGARVAVLRQAGHRDDTERDENFREIQPEERGQCTVQR